ncbi:MAG: hypothetical protein F6J90_07500 [Moorea sp. SIOASIH]|uniref:hypothetical protein n=1 Tax=Moorena sp. SIOASIH TaxID=2607817 RepID=UPI0013B679C9|nr:hypothetical protein [Moorena sp. SIOASIH]NEO36177.1 hypothetical protein [Moorena sp. SIOASIH]
MCSVQRFSQLSKVWGYGESAQPSLLPLASCLLPLASCLLPTPYSLLPTPSYNKVDYSLR